ncbi:hypothetical protein ABH923_002752 [Leifsonia sp. EB41]|uniref:hypothetical protein n=1 Tax=Leifsonia sp. EB41 TaxID=3156260 RepID=UPI003514A15F
MLIWNPETTSAVFFTATTRLPLDPMRRLLGPDDFRLLNGVQGAFDNAEGIAQLATDAAGKQRLAQGLDALRTACVEFSNRVRLVKSEQHTRLVHREARRQLRTDLLRHPVQIMKREWHNRKTRQTQQDG